MRRILDTYTSIYFHFSESERVIPEIIPENIIKTEQKPILKHCSICQAIFTTNHDLNKHREEIHNSLRIFKCELCEKAFFESGHLRSHKQVHREKTFKCDFCEKAFSKKYFLTEHHKTHTGFRPYTCEICLKSFSQTSSFNYHKKMHSGEKPYDCKYCMKKFSAQSVLNTHLKKCGNRWER